MPFPEPTHDNGPRTTATSMAEGRLKINAGFKAKKKKRKILKKQLRKY